MGNNLPGIIVTGASGFIGRHFVINATGKFRIFCVARRTQKEAGIPNNENIFWIQADITKWENIQNVVKYVRRHGGADYVLHLAGYYDFSMNENPAYEETNVKGTRHILDMSKLLDIKRFIFSSSLAACKFPPNDKVLTEKSPPDADIPYAKSKRRGEKVIKEYSKSVPSSVVRLAAVYSDWCEYPPMYMLLKTWLSGHSFMARILGGKGESAVPYIHIKDLINCFLRIIEISDSLPNFTTYIASPQGSVSHYDLFMTATRYFYGKEVKPIRMPKPISVLGLIARSFFGRLIGKEPFEQPWMAKYIDKRLSVDASETYNILGWEPTARYHILRRLLFLTEKMASHPNNWNFRNEALLKKVAYRKSTAIYDILTELRTPLIDKITEEVMDRKNSKRFPNYQKMDKNLLKWYISLNYQIVSATVRNRDRTMIPNYAQIIASRRFFEGFKSEEVNDLMITTGRTMKRALLARLKLKQMAHSVEDYIILTIQFAIDEIEDTYEILKAQPPENLSPVDNIESIVNCDRLKRIIRQLQDAAGDSMDDYFNLFNTNNHQ